MSLQDWAKFRWLKPHRTDLQELSNLLAIADLDSCRAKRNHVEYDYVDGASKSEAEELLTFTKALRGDVVTRLRKKYPLLGLAIEDPPA